MERMDIQGPGATPDDIANYALKLQPSQMLRWLVPRLDADYAFARWRDTRLRTAPRQRRRLCDTAAELTSRSGTQPPLVIIFEAQARPGHRLVARLLEYLRRGLVEFRAGPYDRDLITVAIQVIYLRGKRRSLRVRMLVPGSGEGLRWNVRVHCLERRSASKTLERIERQELGLSVLAWVPLMHGGDDPALVTRWLTLVGTEPDQDLRREYAAIALVWAEWLGRDTIWRDALEGLDVWRSKLMAEFGRQQRAEGVTEGRVEVQRANLRRLLLRWAPAGLPADLDALIEKTTDLGQLGAWFEVALQVQSLDEFRQRLQQAPPNGNGQGTS
jgi:hypothetical protein